MESVVKNPISMQIHCFEIVEKVAESIGNISRIYVPNKWIGKIVRVVLLQ